MNWTGQLRNRNTIETKRLSELTTFRIGGPAEVVTLEDPMDLPEIIACEPKHFLGKGANLLVTDQQLQHPVVRLGSYFRRVERLQETDDFVLLRVGAAHDLALLIGRCCREGLGGIEGLAGVPATIGGALAMNAGTASHWLFDVIERVQVLLPNELEPRWFLRDECEPVYRSSGFPVGTFFIACELRLQRADRSELQTRAKAVKQKKAASQPLHAASAGCMFKNPRPDLAAGKLVQDLGLKGKRIGDAQISEVHGNFILNCGHAQAAEVAELVRFIRAQALHHQNIELHMEVQLWEINPSLFEPRGERA